MSREKAHILIPVVATDSSGAAISGLQISDFLLKAGHGQFSNEKLEEVTPFLLPPDQHGHKKRPVFLVLDKLTIGAPQVGYIEQLILRFLAQSLDSGDPIMLLTIDADGVTLIHSFSTPAPVLAAALQELDKKTHLLGGNFMPSIASETDQNLKPKIGEELSALERLSRGGKRISGLNAASVQMDALYQIGNAGRKFPGRKAILWITSGTYLQFDPIREVMTYLGQQETDNKHYTIQFEGAVEALNEGQTSVYPVVLEVSPGNRMSDALTQMAISTGGELLHLDKDIASTVQSAFRHCATYYLLTHELDSAPKTMAWTKVQVSTTRTDIHLQSTTGFFVLP